eukprot:6184508-Pleurochrysis_carterae.AAC.2
MTLRRAEPLLHAQRQRRRGPRRTGTKVLYTSYREIRTRVKKDARARISYAVIWVVPEKERTHVLELREDQA